MLANQRENGMKMENSITSIKLPAFLDEHSPSSILYAPETGHRIVPDEPLLLLPSPKLLV